LIPPIHQFPVYTGSAADDDQYRFSFIDYFPVAINGGQGRATSWFNQNPVIICETLTGIYGFPISDQ
jgi:hypothetical protein